MLFHQPGGMGTVDIGVVMSVWKGVKSPKMFSGETPVSSCSAFRVVVLDKLGTESNKTWFCTGRSVAWVVRIEALVSILDCESCFRASRVRVQSFCKDLLPNLSFCI